MSEHERVARAALTQLVEPDDDGFMPLLLERGPVQLWRALQNGWVPNIKGAGGIQSRIADIDPARALHAAAECHARFVIPSDEEWPTQLSELGVHAPIGLWVRGGGDLTDLLTQSVALVGARAATAYGEHVAANIAADLADRDYVVVSGGAYGIDGAAHRGALAVEGRTVAVLACGVDVAYPRGHTSLFERIVADGALVSEWPPGCAPMRQRFLVRNRLIAAATLGTVVIEAALRSGARNTAYWAEKFNRPLMVVPGPVTSQMSEGCHELLRREGVRCVTNAAHVIEEVGRIGEDLAPLLISPPTSRDALDETARRVLDAVPVLRPASSTRIAATAGVELMQVRSVLSSLEVGAFVEAVDGGYRLSAESRKERHHRRAGLTAAPAGRSVEV